MQYVYICIGQSTLHGEPPGDVDEDHLSGLRNSLVWLGETNNE